MRQVSRLGPRGLQGDPRPRIKAKIRILATGPPFPTRMRFQFPVWNVAGRKLIARVGWTAFELLEMGLSFEVSRSRLALLLRWTILERIAQSGNAKLAKMCRGMAKAKAKAGSLMTRIYVPDHSNRRDKGLSSITHPFKREVGQISWGHATTGRNPRSIIRSQTSLLGSTAVIETRRENPWSSNIRRPIHRSPLEEESALRTRSGYHAHRLLPILGHDSLVALPSWART